MDNYIRTHDGQYHFFCGINIPWINFAGDAVTFSDVVEKKLGIRMDEIVACGGNTMRWWLHTNGSQSPEFINNSVVGVRKATVLIVKKVLEMAIDRKIMVIVSLWSFDMLNEQGQDIYAMRKLIEDTYSTKTYIEKALIPLVTLIGRHPALLAWEIFNEPEGMTEQWGWTDYRTNINFIQKAVNLMSGAIHRACPGVRVTNSSVTMKTLSDVDGYNNYYTDDRLIAAGGDKAGFLDFYQVHHYPNKLNAAFSPFLYPFAYWQLDKPLLLSEISIPFEPSQSVEDRKEQLCQTLSNLRESGYAGCLFWREQMREGDIAHISNALRS